MAKQTVKKPVNGTGVARTPVIMQMEEQECGAASLAMVLAYYDKWVSLEQVRIDCGVSRDGSNAKNLVLAARHYGLDADGYNYEPEELRREGTFPCIVHWNFDHFVVLNGFRGSKAYINDPSKGFREISLKEFDEAFTGVCLMFEPGSGFMPGGRQKSMLEYAAKYLTGAKAALAFTILMTVIFALIGVISPGFSREFMDRILLGLGLSFRTVFYIMLAAFSLVQVIARWVQAMHSLRLYGKLEIVGSADYLWKIFSLPMLFFSQRLPGDLQNRMQKNAGIAKTLIQVLTPLVMDTLMMVFYLLVMIRYNWIMACIGVIAIGINALISRMISKKRLNMLRAMLRDQAKISSSTVSAIEMIETIKASGAEKGYFSSWAGMQAAVNTQSVNTASIGIRLGTVSTLINTVTGLAITGMGMYLIVTHAAFTVGMLVAFQGYLQAFSSPAAELLHAGQTIQEMRSDMERLEDVMEYPSENVFAVQTVPLDNHKLTGKIEMKHVTFGYSPLDAPLIDDFSLRISQGERIAIVGETGCGKSTVAKLVAGLYQPWSGEILYDDRPLSDIDRTDFTGSVAIVDQDVVLFEDTISANIKMWDDTIEDYEMIIAAKDASVHREIIEGNEGYNAKLLENGKNLSGGQRQRLEIARALAQQPTVLIMDEATSSLDSRTEYEIMRSVALCRITMIIIAHRLSTVRDCDDIIVMRHGKIIAQGTHKELIATCDYYRDLVAGE